MKDETTGSGWLRLEIWVLLLLVVAVTAMRLWQLPAFPYDDDEAMTIAVMKSIAKTGLPLTETGHLYWRALAAHYLMAIPLLFVPVSETSVRLVSVLASGGVLLVAYAMARSAAGRLAGWLTVAVLAASAFEQNFAALARFYMLFQFFFLTAVYFAGRYFIDGRAGEGKWCLLFSILTAGSHEMSVELFPVLALALAIGGRFELLRQRSFWFGCAGLVAAFGLVFYYPKGSYVNYLALPLPPFAMEDKFYFYTSIKEYAPACLSLGLAGWLVVWQRGQQVWRYYLLSFWVCLILLSVISPFGYLRYMANFFPLAVILAAVAGQWLVTAGRQLLNRPKEERVLLRWGAVVLLVCVHLLVGRDWETGKAFGQALTYPDQRPAHDYLLKNMATGDLFISLEPGLSAIYLGRPADYFLREKFDPATEVFSPYSTLEKTSLSVPVLDSPASLAAVLETHNGKIWLYANHKFGGTLSLQMQRLIGSHFKLETVQGSSAVYSTSGQGVNLK